MFMGFSRNLRVEVSKQLVVLVGWFMLDLQNPGQKEFLFVAYATVLAWTELVPPLEPRFKRAEDFLWERLSKLHLLGGIKRIDENLA